MNQIYDDNHWLIEAKESPDWRLIGRLWMGDCTRFASEEAAQVALCGIIAMYAGPQPDVIDRLYRRSLMYAYRWQQWDAVKDDGLTYSEAVIMEAIIQTAVVRNTPRKQPPTPTIRHRETTA